MSDVGFNGRELKVLKDGVMIAGVRTKTGSMVRTLVDVTNDDSDGFQIMLPDAALKAVNLSVEGVANPANLQEFLNDWLNPDFLDCTLQLPDGSTIEAQHGFAIGNLQYSAAHDGAVEFTCELQSSGIIQITPGSS
jgi:predicted secreted protein